MFINKATGYQGNHSTIVGPPLGGGDVNNCQNNCQKRGVAGVHSPPTCICYYFWCRILIQRAGPRLNIKTVLSTYGDFHVKPRSHLADLTADLSRPWWSGEVLWSRRKVGKERGWVLEGPGRSVNLVEVSPTVPGCFELFKTIGSGREWRAVVDRALGSRVRSLEGRWVSVNKVGKGRAWSGRNQDGHRNRPTTTE